MVVKSWEVLFPPLVRRYTHTMEESNFDFRTEILYIVQRMCMKRGMMEISVSVSATHSKHPIQWPLRIWSCS